MAYWLFKTEPDEYSYQDLQAEANGFGCWDGIRNYQARNFLRDQVSLGDGVFIYHSSCQRVGIAGVAKVVRAAYPDPAQFDEAGPYFDVKATNDKPRWFCVDVQAVATTPVLISLAEIKSQPPLEQMALVKQPRLSIQPVTENEWQFIHQRFIHTH